ncbi:MAG: hypothetical protein HQ532_00180 [Candidatus Omnitrophica bacterium]|nr:hypothetical protein [Candidatus Omnitrophota bacterium]
MRKIKFIFLALVIILASFGFYRFFMNQFSENKALKQVIKRLESESRIAEVLVTNVNYDEAEKKQKTTIKFLEYDTQGNPLEPRYFTFSGNIIQFQSLVVRFEDIHIRRADKLRNKSAYFFWKVFMLDGRNTQEYDITQSGQVPEVYKIEGDNSKFEDKLWKQFWYYALNNEEAKKAGIKNAQIEAPGTMFIPGMLYTIKIEHDGGMRIDSLPLPSILKGEKIPK